MSIVAGSSHDMTIRHPTSGLKLPQWTIQLLKNGELLRGVAVSVIENTSQTYTFSFTNDGTHNSTWTLLVYATALPSVIYTETWRVERPLVETALAYLTARANDAK